MIKVQSGDYVVNCLGPCIWKESGRVRLSKGQASDKRLSGLCVRNEPQTQNFPGELRESEREHRHDTADEEG